MWRKLLGIPLPTPSEPPQNGHREPSEPPTAEPGTLAARVSHLESELSTLRLEWSETLDKLGRWASRQSARDRRRVDRDLDQLAGDSPETHEDAPQAANGVPADNGSLIDRVSRKAALRRQLNGR
jgi:hypothetical protein